MARKTKIYDKEQLDKKRASKAGAIIKIPDDAIRITIESEVTMPNEYVTHKELKHELAEFKKDLVTKKELKRELAEFKEGLKGIFVSKDEFNKFKDNVYKALGIKES